jgi:excisionase family DNA binding protein
MSTYARQQTIAEGAAQLRVSPSTMQRLLRAGCPHDRLGPKQVRVSAEEIQAWLVAREAARTAGGAQ